MILGFTFGGVVHGAMLIPFMWQYDPFYAIIRINSSRQWEKEYFVNVMVHELGHALGIPHLGEWESEIMASHGYGCGNQGKNQICNLRGKDFESFLKPYIQSGDDSIDCFIKDSGGRLVSASCR